MWVYHNLVCVYHNSIWDYHNLKWNYHTLVGYYSRDLKILNVSGFDRDKIACSISSTNTRNYYYEPQTGLCTPILRISQYRLRYLIFHIASVDATNRFPIFVDQKVSSTLNIVFNHIPICSPYGQLQQEPSLNLKIYFHMCVGSYAIDLASKRKLT